MDNITVSIVTVVRNGARTIGQTIHSVLDQTYRNIEYIIIDGGSSDGTREIIKKYEDYLAYYISEPDKGIYDAMNKGIRRASGDIIGIINSDDWYEKDAIEKVVGVFSRSNSDLVHGNAYMVNCEGKKWIRKPGALEKIWQYMVIIHPTVFVRREMYEKFGLFDLNYKVAADYDLMLRLYCKKRYFYYLDCVLANFRTGGISERKYEESVGEALRIAKKHRSNNLGDDKGIDLLIDDAEKLQRFYAAIVGDSLIMERVIKEALGAEIKDIAIFGAGIWGARYGEVLKKTRINLACFYDNNARNGEKLLGVNVKIFEIGEMASIPILVAVREGVNDIVEQLNELGVKQYVTVQMLSEVYAEGMV